MRPTQRQKPRRAAPWRVAAALLLASACAMLLPIDISRRVSDILQVLVPFQDGVSRATNALSDSADAARTSGQEKLDAYRSTIESLAADNRRLQRDVNALTRVRARGLGSRGQLIPARVISDDAASWRRSKLILGGTRRGVTRNSGVLSSAIALNLSAENGASAGSAVLASECLIGVIDHAGTYTSRVKLLTDPQTRMPVAVGHVEKGVFSGPDAAFWLVGRGSGGIEIRDVHNRYVTDGSIKLGDTVLTPDDAVSLPPSVTIGYISKIVPDPDNPLLFTLKVAPPVAPDTVRNVYVVALGSPIRPAE